MLENVTRLVVSGQVGGISRQAGSLDDYSKSLKNHTYNDIMCLKMAPWVREVQNPGGGHRILSS